MTKESFEENKKLKEKQGKMRKTIARNKQKDLEKILLDTSY